MRDGLVGVVHKTLRRRLVLGAKDFDPEQHILIEGTLPGVAPSQNLGLSPVLRRKFVGMKRIAPRTVQSVRTLKGNILYKDYVPGRDHVIDFDSKLSYDDQGEILYVPLIRVDPWFPGETFLIAAPGPSFRVEDARLFMGKARTISINGASPYMQWAECVFAYHDTFWDRHQGMTTYSGLKLAVDVTATKWPGVGLVRVTGRDGLEKERDAVKCGSNSAYAAINIAVHMGAKRIALLGMDYKVGSNGQQHFYADPSSDEFRNFDVWLEHIGTLVEPLKALGVEVINCTRDSAIECFPRMTPEVFLDG